MAHNLAFIRLLRVRTITSSTSLASIIPPPKIQSLGKLTPLKSFLTRFESSSGVHSRQLIRNWKLNVQRYTKSLNSGREFGVGGLFSVSAVLGSFILRPRFAYCMDGYASSVDDHSMGMLGQTDTDDNPHSFMIFVKKLMVPIALLLIVWMNWNYPVVLGVKVILTLLSTKPSPFSVYVFVQQLQQQYRGQHPFLHKFKSLYAKKVEVDDYTVLCIAKVEIGDQKYTLLGILGGWWVFDMTSLRSAVSGFKRRTKELLETVVSSDI
ncbi:uncharacterized protein [Rutidosis leptorrhynchoides]|uniref:uncharacterized protein n=1 Tax=Rutidosis leptorrhynchoides TaxID=125765 RepID=UPI003A99B91A